MQAQHLVASSAAACVAVYLMTRRQLGNAEFASLFAILCALVALVALNPVHYEQFVVSQTKQIYEDIVRPKFDRLVHATGGQRVVNKEHKEDDQKMLKEASGNDIAKAIGTKSLKVVNEIALISAFLCNCAQSIEDAKVLKRVGLGPPVYRD